MPMEAVRVNVSDILPKSRLNELRRHDDAEQDAARRAFEQAADKAHHDAWMACVLIRFSDATGLTWLILRKRRAQRTIARALRTIAHKVEPR